MCVGAGAEIWEGSQCAHGMKVFYGLKGEIRLASCQAKNTTEKKGNEQKLKRVFCSRWLNSGCIFFFFSFGDQILSSLFTIVEALYSSIFFYIKFFLVLKLGTLELDLDFSLLRPIMDTEDRIYP